jgi:hypothetical protein
MNRAWIPFIQPFNSVEMVLVPVGCFMMGSEVSNRDNEYPPHQQCFDKLFWIDRVEVTNSQFGSYGFWAQDERPREVVNWFEAREFCLNRGGRLPTEVEWEYAARGPDSLIYPWGNEFVADNVVYGHNSTAQTDLVGLRLEGASWVGALDMSGNVYEWTSTILAPYPYNMNDGRENLTEIISGRVARGGSWIQGEDTVRAAVRVGQVPEVRNNTTGFRCVREFRTEEFDIIAFTNRQFATPTPSAPVVPMVHILAGVNLRSGPGTNYPIIGSAKQGQDLLVLAQTTNGGQKWYMVLDLDNRSMWIAADFVNLQNVSDDQIPIAVTTPSPP